MPVTPVMPVIPGGPLIVSHFRAAGRSIELAATCHLSRPSRAALGPAPAGSGGDWARYPSGLIDPKSVTLCFALFRFGRTDAACPEVSRPAAQHRFSQLRRLSAPPGRPCSLRTVSQPGALAHRLPLRRVSFSPGLPPARCGECQSPAAAVQKPEIDSPRSLGYTPAMLVIRQQCSTLFLPRIASWDATL